MLTHRGLSRSISKFDVNVQLVSSGIEKLDTDRTKHKYTDR